MVNFTVLPFYSFYAYWKQVNFVKLHIFDTKHKINTYNEYLTRSDKCVSIWNSPPSARRQADRNQAIEHSVTCARFES